MATFQTLPGFRDFYPEDFARRNHIFRQWRQTANTFGFAEYDAPVLEPLELYKTKSGDEIEAQLELIALLVQCLATFGLTEADFYVRLSDRNLWFYFLEALGLDAPRARAILIAIDKYEKMGDDAFAAFTAAYGPLDPELKT